MKKRFDVISPVDGSRYLTMEESNPAQIARAIDRAAHAKKRWKHSSMADRIAVVEAFTESLVSQKAEIATSLTMCMGRPSQFAEGEVNGTIDRALYMAGIAEQSLSDIEPTPKDGFKRYIKREPLGVVFVLSPWNYPYLTAVNAVIPAILAGNTVLLKHSDQTPLAAEHFKTAFEHAGLDEGVFQILHMDHETTGQVLGDDCIDFVAFTGSDAGGAAITSALAQRRGRNRFIGAGLELGGNDPAYVRPDANIEHAAVNVIEGALFNSGQSCCGIERIYVHRDISEQFIHQAVAEAKKYRLDDPRKETTTLGPVVRQKNADSIRAQLTLALEAGAHPHIDAATYGADRADTPYLAPQILTQVDHTMAVMANETFGPCVGIMTVDSDEAAIKLMNDTPYGLTASLWTQDVEAAEQLASEIDAGTIFMNRCDYLDPALAWTGVKNSGRGTTLSSIGFENLTRPKSYHLRTEV